MPDPAIPAHRFWLNHRIDTTDNYRAEYFNLHCKKSSYIGNKIMYPPGHSPCGQKANTGRRKSEIGFFAVFFCVFLKRAFVRAWLYCEVKKGTADVGKKNQNPVRKRSGMDGGYGRGISEILPPVVAAEEGGAEEPGGYEGEGIFGRII